MHDFFLRDQEPMGSHRCWFRVDDANLRSLLCQ